MRKSEMGNSVAISDFRFWIQGCMMDDSVFRALTGFTLCPLLYALCSAPYAPSSLPSAPSDTVKRSLTWQKLPM
jgi:hypothetical protein